MSGRSRSAGPSLWNTSASNRDDQGSIMNSNGIVSWLDSNSLRSVFISLVGLFISYSWLKFGIEKSQSWQSTLAIQPAPTLVIYVYSGSDPEYLKNLEFFIREAIKPNDGCDYVIVLQQNSPDDVPWPNLRVNNGSAENPNTANLAPILPSNARFLLHPNECFDLGTVGWVLKTQINNLTKYKYFIWLNSSVRGPFLPPYLRGRLHWSRPFTSKLSTSNTRTTRIHSTIENNSTPILDNAPVVKLVGSTINCGGAQGLPPQPHVQSYITATDVTGLKILLGSPNVFFCWKEMGDVVVHSEIGASKAIFDAGYSIDCLMSRYQGFNWLEYYHHGKKIKNGGGVGGGGDNTKNGNLGLLPCNEGLNPLQPDFNDGIYVDIYELMFIKVKDTLLKAGWRSALAAATTARWIEEIDTGGDVLLDSVQRNAWLEQGMAEKVILEAKKRGRKCFDVDFYLDANAYDLGFFKTLENPEMEAWSQFIEMGVREVIRRQAEKELEAASSLRATLHSSRAQLAQIKRDLAAKAAQDAAAAQFAALSAKDKIALQKQKSGGWVPSLGQFVFVPRLNSKAKVVAVDSSSGVLTLQAGLMKITANLDEVRQR